VSAEDADMPRFNVFTRRDGLIRHFLSGEMGGVTAPSLCLFMMIGIALNAEPRSLILSQEIWQQLLFYYQNQLFNFQLFKTALFYYLSPRQNKCDLRE